VFPITSARLLRPLLILGLLAIGPSRAATPAPTPASAPPTASAPAAAAPSTASAAAPATGPAAVAPAGSIPRPLGTREDALSIKLMIERGDLKKVDEATFRQFLSRAEPAAMLDAALLILQSRPQYQATLVKSERIRGVMPKQPDVISLKYQRQPLAAFCQWMGGPKKGRRVLYNQAVRPREMVAREAGLLGLMAVHIGLDNPILKRDTNHTILELGLEHPIRQAREDHGKMLKAGRRVDPSNGKFVLEGGKRFWEMIAESPGPPEFYTAWARLRFDTDTGLLVLAELRNKEGITLEKIEYKDVKWTKFPASTFDEKNPAYGF